MASKRANRRREAGLAVTELAVCLPALVLLVLGTLEACSTIYLKQNLAIAAYEGARVALISGSTETNIRAQCEKTLADRRITNATIQIAPLNYAAQPPGTFIAVEISAPTLENGLLNMSLFSMANISSRVEMMKEF